MIGIENRFGNGRVGNGYGRELVFFFFVFLLLFSFSFG